MQTRKEGKKNARLNGDQKELRTDSFKKERHREKRGKPLF